MKFRMKMVKIVLNSLIKSIFFYLDLALKLLFWSSISPWAIIWLKVVEPETWTLTRLLAPQGQTALHSLIANVWNDGCSDQIPQRNGLPHSPLFCSRVAWSNKNPRLPVGWESFPGPCWVEVNGRALYLQKPERFNLEGQWASQGAPDIIHTYITIYIYLLLIYLYICISYVVVNPLKIWSSCKHCWLFLVLRIIELFGHDGYVYPPYTWGIIWHMVQYGKLMIYSNWWSMIYNDIYIICVIMISIINRLYWPNPTSFAWWFHDGDLEHMFIFRPVWGRLTSIEYLFSSGLKKPTRE